MSELAEQILEFWFGNVGPDGTDKAWFQSSEDHDQLIRDRFMKHLESVRQGAFESWRRQADSWLAYILLTDQFPRNIFRGQADAFAFDAFALSMAKRGIHDGLDRQLDPVKRVFAYLPLEHSEALHDQNLCCALFKVLSEVASPELGDWLRSSLQFAEGHREIIVRFGRFPHRNSVLGRISSEDELRYLESANRFGQ